MSIMDTKRQTGRSTRALEAVHEKALRGVNVFYVCVDPRRACRMYQQIHGGDRVGLNSEPKVYTKNGASINFVASSSDMIDWKEMRTPGSHPGCEIVFDHYAIERQFGALLEEWHKYDSKKEHA